MRYFQYVEPHPLGGHSMITLSEEDICKRWVAQGGAVIKKEVAIHDFLVNNWGWEVTGATSTEGPLCEQVHRLREQLQLLKAEIASPRQS